MPEFPAELLPSLLKADTTSRASNAEILSFFSKTPLLIDRLRYIRESYKVVFTELLLEDDTRVGFYKESNGLLVWQGSYLTRSAESHLSWHSVTAAISALVDNHELIAAIDPKKSCQYRTSNCPLTCRKMLLAAMKSARWKWTTSIPRKNRTKKSKQPCPHTTTKSPNRTMAVT